MLTEFTVAEGKIIEGGWACVEGRQYEIAINSNDVTYVSGQSNLWETNEKWTEIVVRGIGPIYVKGSYQETMEKLRTNQQQKTVETEG